MSALLEFECRVPVDGYEVITVEETFEGERRKFRMLHPLSERTRSFDLFQIGSSAFLEFAQTATEDGIKRFADRYGQLIPDLDLKNIKIVGKLRKSVQFRCQMTDLWFAHIRQMRRCIEYWNISRRAGNFSKLIRAIQRNDAGYSLGTPVGLFLKENPLSASPSLCIRPRSLFDALWTQLLLAIDGNLNLRGCVQCRKWFKLAAGQGRSDKEYCSDACRMRAYRKRKGTG